MPCRCEGESEAFGGVVEDLSLGGVAVIDPTNIPRRGSAVEVTLRPDKESVTLNGRVVYVKPSKSGIGSLKVGVRFHGRLSEKRELLSDFLPRPTTSSLLPKL
jgi:hypothetical protein